MNGSLIRLGMKVYSTKAASAVGRIEEIQTESDGSRVFLVQWEGGILTKERASNLRKTPHGTPNSESGYNRVPPLRKKMRRE